MKCSMTKFMYSLAILGMLAFLVNCSDDDGNSTPEVVPTFSISGTISYVDFDGNTVGADGAVVYMAQSEMATTSYDASTVASTTGAYSFEGLEAGSYFVFSNFNNANVNNGRIVGVNFDSGEGALVEIVDANVTSDMTLTQIAQDVDFVIDTDGDWDQDYSHSNIDFSFAYDENNATYTGRFDAFTSDVFFDANDLANSSISASVDLLSVNTSSPGGRDSWWNSVDEVWDYGCLASTFGLLDTDGNALGDADPPVMPDESTRFATFESTSIETYGDGFRALGNFTFNGSTNEETLFFRFINGFEGQNFQGNSFRFSSFDGQIEFDALADYGVESSSLGNERVTVDISFQLELPLCYLSNLLHFHHNIYHLD